MDTDQLQSKYDIQMKQLHKAKKKALRLLEKEETPEGTEILTRYIQVCREEIKNLRMNYILSLPIRSDYRNFYPPNRSKCAEAYDYYLNMGFGILSAPMKYEEFLQRVSKIRGNNSENIGKFFAND